MEIYQKLAFWYENEKRDLPWRNTSDPYKIWISEIILQQTRVAQGTAYYNRFISEFPDIFSLAKAETHDVLKMWQGLGYYSRARNLHETARFIVSHNSGQFPVDYSELLKLKGIGDYTAAAIASIAYNEPKAAIDGNVKRVISRLFRVEEEINSLSGKKNICSLAEQILDKANPGRHNQAIMELGAGICLPKNPSCFKCPLNSVCLALKSNKVAELPLKYKKTKVKNRYFTYLIIKKDDTIYLKQRTQNDIWKGLYEFPLIESDELPEIAALPGIIGKFLNADIKNFQINSISEPVNHKLSHRNIFCRFINISVSGYELTSPLSGTIVNIDKFDTYPVPTLIDRYVRSIGL